MRARTRIAVVFSSNSAEAGVVVHRTIQLRSWSSYRDGAEQIADALRSLGFLSVEVVGEGPELYRALLDRRYDLVWLNCGGIQGRGSMGHTASVCESLGVPFVGHSPLQAALMDDKVLMKQWLRGVGLPTAPFIVRFGGRATTLSSNDGDFAQEFGRGFRGPFLVKPAQGRGSVMVQLVEDVDAAMTAAEAINRQTQDRVIIEQFVEGQEYCVWVSGGTLVADGAVVAEHRISVFGYSERLFLDQGPIFVKKERVPGQFNDLARLLSPGETRLREDLDYLARVVFSGLSLSVPIRLDARRDSQGFLQILEVNPKPDIRKPDPGHSGLLAVALQDLGTTYEGLMLKTLADWLSFHLRVQPGILAGLRLPGSRGFGSNPPPPTGGRAD